MRPLIGLCWMGVCFGSTFTAPVHARSEAEVAYTRVQAFSAALRYLRVDLAYEVTEKDAEAAYLLFTFAAPELPKKQARGSIEVVERDRSVRVVVNLPELPSYQEEVLKRGLLAKLRSEYGEPKRPSEADEASPDRGSRKRRGRPAEPSPEAPSEPGDGEPAPP